MHNHVIHLKRVYDPPDKDDGKRFLVDRLWPRGVKKESLLLDEWLKNVAPSNDLRHWFGHEPSRWEEFCRRYGAELEGNREAWQPLLEAAAVQTVTLLFSAHDPVYNNAAALRSFLEEALNGRRNDPLMCYAKCPCRKGQNYE